MCLIAGVRGCHLSCIHHVACRLTRDLLLALHLRFGTKLRLWFPKQAVIGLKIGYIWQNCWLIDCVEIKGLSVSGASHVDVVIHRRLVVNLLARHRIISFVIWGCVIQVGNGTTHYIGVANGQASFLEFLDKRHPRSQICKRHRLRSQTRRGTHRVQNSIVNHTLVKLTKMVTRLACAIKLWVKVKDEIFLLKLDWVQR